MYSFKNDYAEGAHPKILQALLATNQIQTEGYGEDIFSQEARLRLKELTQNPSAAIYFVSGGTQANLLVISSLLQPHEAVIAADTGHISTHETGAIEATGHKVIHTSSTDGKLYVPQLQEIIRLHQLRPHMVKPRLVYISNSTETGTIYSREELEALSHFCKENQLLLYLDGARLGHALMAKTNNISLSDISRLTDVFYLGGTKNGALCGEAVLFRNTTVCPYFDYILKQKGALLAKGRLLGIQFLELFRENLYFELALHANRMMMRIKEAVIHNGYSLLTDSFTNQLFPVLPRNLIRELRKDFDFYDWENPDENHTTIRLITSWATPEYEVDHFIQKLGSNLSA